MIPLRPVPSIALAALLACPFTAAAQTPPPPADTSPAATGRIEQRIERIQIEDAGSRIDELRVGGETQNITVSPKGGMPPYEVLPGGANRELANGRQGQAAQSGGTRMWKVFGF